MFPSGRRLDRSTALFVTLLAVGFLIATFDVRSSSGSVTTVIRGGAQTLVAPVQQGIDFVVRPVMGFIDGISNVAGLSDQNERLEAEVQRLEQRLLETAALERRVAELEAINDLDPPEDLATVTARIYSAGASTFDQIRLVNRGSDDGIVVGQAVVDEDGLIGRVDLVTKSSARLRLITDPLVSVGVRVQDTNQTGVTTGRGDELLRLDMFDATQPVREGAVVLTDGSLFPPGIVVGFANETKSADVGFSLRTTVDPAVAFSQLDFVKIVVGWSPLDADPQSGDPLVDAPSFTDPGAGRE
ncbi:MAG: rod shape-determining protein MreC [Actinomycetota bacterium]|nr:rod shape-determining protein MreC [Actinomycetota bacterium]